MNPDPESSGGKRPNSKIDLAFEQAARISGTDMPITAFFEEFLKITLEGIEAPAGAIWVRNPQGFLQLQCQTNIDGIGLDNHKNGRQSHNELLRQAFQTAKPILLEPFGSTGILEGIPAGNPTDYVVLLAPILLDEKTALGLVEVWQEPRWDARAKRHHLNYVVQMSGYASTYFRNQQGRATLNQEQLWTQLEAFACQIHATLDPTTVAYHVANEGRRLIGCDRLTVAYREGKKAKIEAVSGSDVVEKRATQVKLMRKLAQAVFKWDDKLVYRGQKDDGLPPDVYEALDKYLAESAAKLLVVQPLRDPREKDKDTKEYKPGKARSALLMECFEPPAQPEPLLARMDVIGKHASSALFNAAMMRNIPLGFLWKPVLMVQEGLGGRARFLTILTTVITTLVIIAMVLVPYELKMDAKGQMLPVELRTIYAPHEGVIERFNVVPGQLIRPDGIIAAMYDPGLESRFKELAGTISKMSATVENQRAQAAKIANEAERNRYLQESHFAANVIELDTAIHERRWLQETFNANADRVGGFHVRAPRALASDRRVKDPMWEILSGNDFRELQGRRVKPSDSLLRLGYVSGEWWIEIKIPQKHIGQILEAYKAKNVDELDVDLKLESLPTHTYRGKLARRKIAPEAVPNRDDHNETEPVVYAYVRISGDDISADDQIPTGSFITGVEVRAKVRCGEHSLGYSLFYGVWEFICEKWFWAF